MNLHVGVVLCFVAIFLGVHFQKQDHSHPYEHLLAFKTTSSDHLVVDLGYEIYKGYHNQTSKLNIWKGYPYNSHHSSKSLTGPKNPLCGTTNRGSQMAKTTNSSRKQEPHFTSYRAYSSMSGI